MFAVSQNPHRASKDKLRHRTVCKFLRYLRAVFRQIHTLCVQGRIYTTSALFAEGIDDVETWHRSGFSAADLETAATFAVAKYFGVDRISIVYAFDNARKQEHILLNDAEKVDCAPRFTFDYHCRPGSFPF
jgi:purine-nucleoside phosphorylase